MRVPITTLRRTPAECADVRLSWERPDIPFFAAGACHILESELLDAHRAAFLALSPDWSADVLDVDVPLAEFCAANQHRAPWDFPPGVWARAHTFLSQVPGPPARA